MPRSMWTGTLSFGLVSVPVKLYSAVVHKNVHFHQLHGPDHSRIQQKRVCSTDGEEVPFSEIVKGFEIAPERYVVIEPDEFAALEPAFTRTIDIEDFVELTEIDPIYFDHPYFLVPGKGGAKSYRLLLEAMRGTGKVAIARIVLRSRERLVAIRPQGRSMLMTTMNFADEIQSIANLRELEEADVKLGDRELAVAKRLVQSISEPFEISKYHDLYREALLDLIDRKANGEEVAIAPAPKRERPEATDLMSALQASIEEVRQRKGGHSLPVDELPDDDLLMDEGGMLTEDLLLDEADDLGEADRLGDADRLGGADHLGDADHPGGADRSGELEREDQLLA